MLSALTPEELNSACMCVSLDSQALRRALESELGRPGLFDLVKKRCPYLFAAQPVFISCDQIERMTQVINAVESVVALAAFRKAILADAPAIAEHDPRGAKGVLFGYDFHVHGNEFGLIEINTNAGGAMLNAVLARAQRICCSGMDMLPVSLAPDELEQSLAAMFLAEWRLARGDQPLRTIAIVDEEPEQQYLYPEFLLFQQLFMRFGLQAVIADPRRMSFRNGELRCDDTVIDLVYNRLTDFMLKSPENAAVRDAYLANAIVLTPHPQAHALYADKRNLALLCDRQWLQDMGVPQKTQDILVSGIPHTEVVKADDAERLWDERRRLFFKPRAGYGSRAAYRGDKITKRVWKEILAGDYVAQRIVAPGERIVESDEAPQRLKFDVRNYAYDGTVQCVAARLYQGQTTNFRTPHGGFAPVYSLAGA